MFFFSITGTPHLQMTAYAQYPPTDSAGGYTTNVDGKHLYIIIGAYCVCACVCMCVFVCNPSPPHPITPAPPPTTGLTIPALLIILFGTYISHCHGDCSAIEDFWACCCWRWYRTSRAPHQRVGAGGQGSEGGMVTLSPMATRYRIQKKEFDPKDAPVLIVMPDTTCQVAWHREEGSPTGTASSPVPHHHIYIQGMSAYHYCLYSVSHDSITIIYYMQEPLRWWWRWVLAHERRRRLQRLW